MPPATTLPPFVPSLIRHPSCFLSFPAPDKTSLWSSYGHNGCVCVVCVRVCVLINLLFLKIFSVLFRFLCTYGGVAPPSPQSSVTSSRWRWGRECCVHAECVVRAGREYKRVTLSGRVLCERFSTQIFFLIVHFEKVSYRLKHTKKKWEQHKKNSNGYSSLELRRDMRTKGRNKNVAFERSAGTESHESVKNKSTKTKQETCHMKYPGFFFLFFLKNKQKQNKIVTYLYLSKKLNECFPLWYAF